MKIIIAQNNLQAAEILFLYKILYHLCLLCAMPYANHTSPLLRVTLSSLYRQQNWLREVTNFN